MIVRIRAGVEIVGDVTGPATGRTVLFLHAGGETRGVWTPIAKQVTEHGWRTVAIDLRGHGASGRAEEYALDDFIEDTVATLSQACGQPVVIVGGSIGGAIGLIVAGERRTPVHALVLLDTPTRIGDGSGARSEQQKISSAQARGAPSLAHVDPKFISGSFVTDVVRDSARWSRAAKQLSIPVLFVEGEQSAHRHPLAVAATREDIPHVQVATAPGGHLLARDCPRDIARLVVTFLDSLPSS